MSIDVIIIYIMVIFMVIGGIDKCFGNKFGYGEKFEEGIMAMGSLAVAMVGILMFFIFKYFFNCWLICKTCFSLSNTQLSTFYYFRFS